MKAEDVLQLEKELSFETFDDEDVYNIAGNIVKRIKDEKIKNIRMRVILNNELVYQYLMNGKKGEYWLNRKQNTIEKYGHSGYYMFLENEENGTYKEIEEDENYVLCGGAFPIIVKGKMIGCFIVSGLAHEEDHQLIVDALKEYKERIEK